MAYQSPRTWAAGDTPTAAQLNQDLRDNVAFLANPPRVRVYHSVAQSITNATWTALSFNSERWDTDTMHSTASNTSRLVAKTAGLFRIFANCDFASNATGLRGIAFRFNGTGLEIFQKLEAAVNGNIHGLAAYTEYVFAVNEYVEVFVFQSSTGNLNVDSTAAYSPEFGMTWASL